jgi:uncharacterized protein
MKKDFSPRKLDVKAFAMEHAVLSGQDSVSMHPRLLAEAKGLGADRPVTWSARGEIRNPQHVHPQVWLHLQAQAELPMNCQRCLHPVDVAVRVDRAFRFVADEQTAAAEDDESEEDVLAISRSFDLVELVEDELLMELPAVPRHEVCPQPVTLSAADPEFQETPEKANPFAMLLGQLKPRKG